MDAFCALFLAVFQPGESSPEALRCFSGELDRDELGDWEDDAARLVPSRAAAVGACDISSIP